MSRVDVRRSRTALLRSSAIWIAIGGLVVFLLPAMVVLMRRENNIFTAGIWIQALIALGAFLIISIGALVLWSSTGSRRTEFADPILSFSPESLSIAAAGKRPAAEVPWERVEWLQIVGRRRPLLAIGIAEPADEKPKELRDPAEPADYVIDPIDFEHNPPPPTVPPDAQAWERLALQENETPQEPESEPEIASPEPDSVTEWNEQLYATPYVVSLVHCTPTVSEVRTAFIDYSGGHVRQR